METVTKTHKMKIKNKPYPCLDKIRCGEKIYEGISGDTCRRLGLAPGDTLFLIDEDDEAYWVKCLVTELLPFPDFGSAYDVLGEKLIPGSNREEVVKLYEGFHPITPKDVIIIGIEVEGYQHWSIIH